MKNSDAVVAAINAGFEPVNRTEFMCTGEQIEALLAAEREACVMECLNLTSSKLFSPGIIASIDAIRARNK